MYEDIQISEEMARQFATDCFDAIISDIKVMEEKEQEMSDNYEEQ